MVAFASEEFIGRPPEDVFPYLTDPAKHSAWMDVSEAQSIDGQPAHIGSRIRTVIAKGPLHLKLEYEVSELEPNRKFAYRSTAGPMNWNGQFTIRPEGAGSRIASAGTMELRGLLRILSPLMAAEVRNGEAAELRKLKQLVERGNRG